MKHYNGKLVIGGIASALLGCLLTGCVAADPEHADGPASEEDVPVVLHAGRQTKAVIGEREAFDPLLLCTAVSGDYTAMEWQKKASVATDGTVTYTGETPAYPHLGDYIYVTGLHPSDGSVADGKITCLLDGQTDLMYASELAGNRWDGFRIYGNSDPSKNKTLEFRHLLSQLQFAAIRTASELIGKKEFRILSIRIKDVPGQAVVRLGTVENEDDRTSWSQPAILQPVLYKDPSDTAKNKLITSSDPEHPDKTGWVLLPPGTFYLADIETTVGNFSDIKIRPDEGPFTRGLAHEVVFVLNDKGLSVIGVRQEDWTDAEGGEIEMN